MRVNVRLSRFPLWTVLAAIYLGVAAVSSWLTNLRGDFAVYYQAAARTAQGLTPYTFFSAPHPLAAYQYTPWGAWLLLPLTPLPLNAAQHLFVAINIAMLVAMAVWLPRLFWRGQPPHWRVLALASVLALSTDVLSLGQYSVVVAFGATLLLAVVSGAPGWLAAIGFPLLLIKPHLVMLAAPAILLCLPRKSRLLAVASVTLCTLLAFALYPSWPLELLSNVQRVSALDTPAAHSGTWYPMSLPALLGAVAPLSYAISALLLCSGGLLLYRLRHLKPAAWLALSLLLSILAAPYAQRYDLVLLIPALYWLAGRGKPFLLMASPLAIFVRLGTYTYLVALAFAAIAIWYARPNPD